LRALHQFHHHEWKLVLLLALDARRMDAGNGGMIQSRQRPGFAPEPAACTLTQKFRPDHFQGHRPWGPFLMRLEDASGTATPKQRVDPAAADRATFEREFGSRRPWIIRILGIRQVSEQASQLLLQEGIAVTEPFELRFAIVKWRP
jgi:hypothetical protein